MFGYDRRQAHLRQTLANIGPTIANRIESELVKRDYIARQAGGGGRRAPGGGRQRAPARAPVSIQVDFRQHYQD